MVAKTETLTKFKQSQIESDMGNSGIIALKKIDTADEENKYLLVTSENYQEKLIDLTKYEDIVTMINLD